MSFSFDGLKERWRREREESSRISRAIREDVVTRCPAVFERYGVRKAFLYGSVIKERARRRSDVDLLVLPLENEDYWDLLHDLEEVLKRPVDLYTDRDDAAWVRKVQEQGEMIYDRQD